MNKNLNSEAEGHATLNKKKNSNVQHRYIAQITRCGCGLHIKSFLRCMFLSSRIKVLISFMYVMILWYCL